METYLRLKGKTPRKENMTIPFPGGHIIVVDADMKCIMLTEDYRCSIYNERPEVCRKFGEDNHPLLQCPYLKKN